MDLIPWPLWVLLGAALVYALVPLVLLVLDLVGLEVRRRH